MDNNRDLRNLDPQRALRAAVARMDDELSRLAKGGQGADAGGPKMDGLLERWAALVTLMGVAPAPELRECPTCGNVVMRAATLCSSCWSKLRPSVANT